MILERQRCENIIGKGENAGNKHFLLFPECFLVFQGQILLWQPSVSFAIYTFILDQAKTLSLVVKS